MIRKNVIRVGDTVRIINPAFFLRCGYPLSYEDAVNVINASLTSEIYSLLNKVPGLSTERYYHEFVRDLTAGNIERELAKLYLKLNRYGGRERKIYSEIIDQLKGREAVVHRKFVKYTGTYYPGYRASAWDDGDESEPAYLGNAKAHVILVLGLLQYDGNNYRIEQENVEKLT